MDDTVHRYYALLENIAATAIACNRNPQEIALIAVSKYHSWNELAPFYNAGQRFFGESRPQELLAKIEGAPSDVQWHFIGPLQKNKVRKLIGKITLIHSVDSLELAQKISTCSLEASITTPVLLQINTSRERSKQGMTISECLEQSDLFLELLNVSIAGLMTMAPLTENKEDIRHCFAQLRELRNTLQSRYGPHTFPHLSMGMSHDYQLAIAEGATFLRVGSLLF